MADKKKLLLTTPNFKLSKKILAEEFELVDSVKDLDTCDYILCWCSVPDIILCNKKYLDKTILCQYEGPLTAHRIMTYANFDKFLLVANYNSNDKNVIKFSENTIFFPTNPAFDYDRRRKDTTMTKRGIFYAGGKSYGYLDNYIFGSYNLKNTRDRICEYLIKNYKETTVLGIGWNNKSAKEDMWRRQKQDDIEQSGADFVLCMENQILNNYVTEKFHDGFSSDRVMLYLGDPIAINNMPPNCFINLNPYFNKETFGFDSQKIIDIITSMTQEEYDTIINNARKWRDSIPKDIHKKKEDAFTLRIINKLKEIENSK